MALAAAYAPAAAGARSEASSRATPRPGFFRRLLDAMIESRRRQADMEIARILGPNGRLTDDVERRIGEQMFGAGRRLL